MKKVIYYIYDKDDFRTPEKVYKQDWMCNVTAEHINLFDTEEEAEEWCRELNWRYISRKPYIVRKK